jgi:hypothetical protein
VNAVDETPDMSPDLDRWLPPKDVSQRVQWAKTYPARSALLFTIGFFPFVAAFAVVCFIETETPWISVATCVAGSAFAFIGMFIGNKRLARKKSNPQPQTDLSQSEAEGSAVHKKRQ